MHAFPACPVATGVRAARPDLPIRAGRMAKTRQNRSLAGCV